jgi:hypothetical protein
VWEVLPGLASLLALAYIESIVIMLVRCLRASQNRQQYGTRIAYGHSPFVRVFGPKMELVTTLGGSLCESPYERLLSWSKSIQSSTVFSSIEAYWTFDMWEYRPSLPL